MGFYNRFKKDFINFVATFSLWHLKTMKGKSFCLLFQKLKNEWWNEFEVTNKKKFFIIIKIFINKFKILWNLILKTIKI